MSLALALGTAALALFAALAWWLAPLEPTVLALQFAATPRAFGLIMHLWPPEHLALYRAHFAADFVLLGCYGAFGWLWVRRAALFAALPPRRRLALALMLPLAALFDAAENALHLWLTAAPRFGVPLPYLVSAVCAALKWALLLGFAAAVAWTVAAGAPRAGPGR